MYSIPLRLSLVTVSAMCVKRKISILFPSLRLTSERNMVIRSSSRKLYYSKLTWFEFAPNWPRDVLDTRESTLNQEYCSRVCSFSGAYRDSYRYSTTKSKNNGQYCICTERSAPRSLAAAKRSAVLPWQDADVRTSVNSKPNWQGSAECSIQPTRFFVRGVDWANIF